MNGSRPYEHVETVAWETTGGREKWIGARDPWLSGTRHSLRPNVYTGWRKALWHLVTWAATSCDALAAY